jgi:hypothetical protein
MPTENPLASLYQSFKDFEAIKQACGSDLAAREMIGAITAPFLIKANEEYLASKLGIPRVVVVGRETRGWYGSHKTLGDFLANGSIEEATEHYEMVLCQFRQSTFLQRLDEIRRDIFGAHDPSVTMKPILWLNLFKCAHGSMVRSPYMCSVLRLQDGIFQQEISSLNPFVAIFLTGSAYDGIISSFFPGIRFASIGEFRMEHAARLHHDLLPPFSFRTYHPSRRKFAPAQVDGCLQAILAIIKAGYGLPR